MADGLEMDRAALTLLGPGVDVAQPALERIFVENRGGARRTIDRGDDVTGLVDRPQGVGKGAYYTEQHVEQLLLVRKWQLAGLSLERIGEVLKHQGNGPLPPAPRRPGTIEVWSHMVVADGVEVTLDPSRSSLSPEQVRAFFRAVARAYEQLGNGDSE